MARQQKVKRSLVWLMLFAVLLLVSPVEAGEITNPAEMVMSGNIDPVLTARLNSQTTLYQVEPGDTLWGIARKYQVDWELIWAMNDLRDTYLTSGQILVLPTNEEEIQQEVYRVRPGDTLSYIAREFNVSLRDLIAKNNIKDPNMLYVGQKITIPQASQYGVPVFKEIKRQIVSRGDAINLFWPVTGQITSPFGPRGRGFHHGLDIAAPTGTVIKAADDGEVIFSGWKNGVYGYTVIVDHKNGTKTMYSHNSANLVKKGEWVSAGQAIARIGATGNATGPHVHFGVYKNDKLVDPEKYLSKR